MEKIVRLTAADATLLASVGSTSLIESHGHSAPDEIMQAYKEKYFSEEACCAELQDESNVFSVIFHNGEPAGYFKIIYDVPHPAVSLQPVTKLERLYLLKEFYDLKLGHQLLQEAVDLSKAAGDKGMWLEVWQKNERAVSFYQKQGFKTIGEDRFVLSPTHANPIWVMLLRY
ncbi:MAG: GNAT family N-acetyltransferase [Chitinophagaceae bacterium]|nr:MAG: GNAT family N-acetyltransferase [Chitinophagaceae bacterium]